MEQMVNVIELKTWEYLVIMSVLCMRGGTCAGVLNYCSGTVELRHTLKLIQHHNRFIS